VVYADWPSLSEDGDLDETYQQKTIPQTKLGGYCLNRAFSYGVNIDFTQRKNAKAGFFLA
jgi:hypothetical protein